jgi:cation transport ATPase
MSVKKALLSSFAGLATLLLVGCAGHKASPKYIAPAITKVSIPVERTASAIAKAKYSLEKQDYTETKKNLIEAEKQANATKTALEDYHAQVETQANQLNEAIDLKNKAEVKAEEKTKEAHQNAKERDVLVYVWAVFFALWLLATAGAVVDLLPPQYRIAGKILFLLLGFGVGYALGRFILRWLAYLFP